MQDYATHLISMQYFVPMMSLPFPVHLCIVKRELQTTDDLWIWHMVPRKMFVLTHSKSIYICNDYSACPSFLSQLIIICNNYFVLPIYLNVVENPFNQIKIVLVEKKCHN